MNNEELQIEKINQYITNLNTETEYYSSCKISNSDIGYFLKNGPAYLYKKLNDRTFDTISTEYLSKGIMIHMFLLQPEEFNKNYMVFNGEKPQSVNQEKFCSMLINSVEIMPDKSLLSAYKSSYKTTGSSDDLILSKAKEIANKLKNYIDIKTKYPKVELITKNSKTNLLLLEYLVKQHKAANEILYPTEGVTYHEFRIDWEFKTEYGVINCKSLLDSINFNFKNKICIISDLKTTNKIGHFEDSVKEYDYFRQICFYIKATKWFLENILDENAEEWKFDCNIVCISTSVLPEIRVFKITEEQIQSREKTINDSLSQICWHYANNKWDHHLEYYNNNGFETLESQNQYVC